MRFGRVLAIVGLGMLAIVVWATVLVLWRGQSVARPASAPLAETATPRLSVQFVAEVGTPFPTNIPSAPPAPTATVTPTPVSPGDTLSPPTPTPMASAAGVPVDAENDRFILVNQGEQMMHLFENGQEVRALPISSGRPVTNAFTPPWRGVVGDDWGGGAFRESNLYSDFMWFLFPGPEGSILIHSVPYQKIGTEKVYDHLDALGVEPVSNGCVRISPEDAAWLKQWNPVGVPIEITRWPGKINSAE